MPETANVTARPPTDWTTIRWYQAYKGVKNLRPRIFRASREGDLKKVRSLQTLMLRSYSNVMLSTRRVTQVNKGRNTPGVDKRVVKTPEARGRLVDSLATFQPWKAKPARRVCSTLPSPLYLELRNTSSWARQTDSPRVRRDRTKALVAASAPPQSPHSCWGTQARM